MQSRGHERALRAGARNCFEVFEVTYAARNINGAWPGPFERGAEPVDVGSTLCAHARQGHDDDAVRPQRRL